MWLLENSSDTCIITLLFSFFYIILSFSWALKNDTNKELSELVLNQVDYFIFYTHMIYLKIKRKWKNKNNSKSYKYGIIIS